MLILRASTRVSWCLGKKVLLEVKIVDIRCLRNTGEGIENLTGELGVVWSEEGGRVRPEGS